MTPHGEKVRIAFLVRALDVGGAEVQLSAIARGLDPDQFDVSVIYYYAGGSLVQELRDAGVGLYCLEKSGRWDLIPFFFRLLATVRVLRPAILHGFLSTSNILTSLLKPLVPGLRVIWGVRASNMDHGHYDITWRVSFALERLLSRHANRIIANSRAGRDHILENGFSGGRIEVVLNGIDTDNSSNDGNARQRLRAEWRIPAHEQLIGIIARLDPMKDHITFLRAAAQLATTHDSVRFVCVGNDGLADGNGLRALADELGIADRIVWAGFHADIRAVHKAIDLHTSCSAFGEGFSNSIAEAMASGIPNVVTDVGDSADIVGELGVVVPPRSPGQLALAWGKMLSLSTAERRSLAERCRQRILDNFSRRAMIERMTAIYQEEAARRGKT
jgi:glycosyltransferase involved in cell wall biosynthesis